MDVTKGIAHLNHIEDLVLMYGVSGINTALDTVRKFVNPLSSTTTPEEKKTSVSASEKIDGSMSIYFGKDDQGRFFVSTKAILSKEPKIGYSLADIQRHWNNTGVQDVLMNAWKALKLICKKTGVVYQGDLLWASHADKKITEHDGQKVITFQPNTILYAIPVDPKSPLYKNVKTAQIGIVLHGVYKVDVDESGMHLSRMSDKQIRPASEELNQSKNVFVIDPLLDEIVPFEGSQDIIDEIKDLIISVEKSSDEISTQFNDEWNSSDEPMIKQAKKYFLMFINQQVRSVGDQENILAAENEDSFLKIFKKKLKEFITTRNKEDVSKLKTSNGRDRKTQQSVDFQKWIDDMEESFEPMLRAFYRLTSIKLLLLSLFGSVEKKIGKTYLVDKQNDFSLTATKPEGYVLLNGPNMVKIVDRAEFSKNNFLYSPFNESKQVTKYVPSNDTKRISDEILEDIIDKMSAMESIYGGFTDENLVEAAEKYGEMDVIYVGRFQPATIAHVKNIVDLSKLFRKVYVLISESNNQTKKYLMKNPMSAQERIDLMMSDLNINRLKNVVIKSGLTNMIFSLPHIEAQKDIRKLFKSPKDRSLVLALGKEDDRYYEIKERGNMFVLNDGEFPSEEKTVGLYGMDLQKNPNEKNKISAETIRDAIVRGDDQLAKDQMAGSDEKIEEILPMLREKLQSLHEDDYITIEGFDVDKEIISEIQEDYAIDQISAMEMIFDILQMGD